MLFSCQPKLMLYHLIQRINIWNQMVIFLNEVLHAEQVTVKMWVMQNYTDISLDKKVKPSAHTWGNFPDPPSLNAEHQCLDSFQVGNHHSVQEKFKSLSNIFSKFVFNYCKSKIHQVIFIWAILKSILSIERVVAMEKLPPQFWLFLAVIRTDFYISYRLSHSQQSSHYLNHLDVTPVGILLICA